MLIIQTFLAAHFLRRPPPLIVLHFVRLDRFDRNISKKLFQYFALYHFLPVVDVIDIAVGQIYLFDKVRKFRIVINISEFGRAAVRQITEKDHQILAAASKNPELEPRARILPEEQLEASLLLGNEMSVEELLREEQSGIAEKRREYLDRQAPTRNKNLAKELQKIYEGKCQICLWSPRDIYGVSPCHAHHIHRLSRGGEDCIENLVLICPNHHSAIHGCVAPLDYENFSFEFGSHRENIKLSKHKINSEMEN